MRYFGQIKAFNLKDNTMVLGLDDLSTHEKNLFSNNVGNYLGIDFDDKRVISYKQQRKAYSLLNDITRYQNSRNVERTKKLLKGMYCEDKGVKPFSLSNCSVSVANGFIDYMINFCLEWGIEFATESLDIAKDSYYWERYCLDNGKCCICGDKMQIAHVHAIGIGLNRNKINHVGYTILPLCFNHHKWQHDHGINTFLDRYKLQGVRVDKELTRQLKIGRLHDKYEIGEDIVLNGG